MTQQLSVSGTLSPDATTANTGPPAGTHEGQPYWQWTNDAGTWFLSNVNLSGGLQWAITSRLGAFVVGVGSWRRPDNEPAIGEYSPVGSATGIATVAEVPPAPAKLLVLEWHVGPHAGKYTLLREDL
jgi:hypothetical protein